MSLTSRLLGVRAAAPTGATARPANGRAPSGGDASVWYSTPGQPQIPEWDGTTAIRSGYQASIYIMQPVRIIANALGSLPFRVGTDPDKPTDYDTAAPLAQLLGPPPGGPNPVTSPRNLWIWSIVQRLLAGKMAWETVTAPGSDVPVALWPLVAPFVHPIPSVAGSARWFDRFEYALPGRRIPYRADQVFYSWRPSQLDWRQPESALQAANMPASLQIALDRYMWALARNGLAAKKLVVTPEFAEDDERRAWEEQFASEFTGYDNGGRVMHGYYEDDPTTTTAGARTPPIQVVDLASTPADAQVLDILKTAKDDMLRAWRVPMSWMGDASQRCLRQTEWVRLADGRRVQAKDLAGTSFRLLTATDSGQVSVNAHAEWESTCEVFRVTTESGRTLEVNANHPLYAGVYETAVQYAARNSCRKQSTVTPRGWTPVGQLRDSTVHWVVAVPTRFHQQHTPGSGLTEDEAFIVGALIGDGSISQPACSPRLTTPDGPFAKEFIRAVEAIGDDVVRYQTGERVAAWATRGRPENRKGRGSKGCNQTRRLLDRLGLIGTTSRTKFVPDEAFASSLPAQVAFLSGLFAADGHVSRVGNTRGVSLCTVSRRLAADVQELLLRVGVCARIREGSCLGGIGSTRSVRHRYFTVDVTATEDLERLCMLLPVPGKQDRLDALLAALPTARNTGWRRQGLMPQLRWERVVSVTPLGVDRTVGIQVPGHHTYLGTFFEHNTYENASQEAKNFWQGPVLELAAEICDDVNQYLAPRFGDGLVGWFDFSRVEALKAGNIFAQIAPDNALKAGLIQVDDWRNDVGLPPINPSDVLAEALPAVEDTPGGTSMSNFSRRSDEVADQALGFAALRHRDATGGWPNLELPCGHRAGTCTGPGPCDVSPFGAGHNWVNAVGGLPAYIRAIAHALHRSGHDETTAIATAVATVKRWASGGGGVSAQTRARAGKALAEWEAKKAAAHSRDAMTEAGSSGLLIPQANPQMRRIQRHLFALNQLTPRKCAICGQTVGATVHRTPTRPQRKRHAGPGHAPVPTGHDTTRRRATLAAVHRQAESLEPAIHTAMTGLFAAQRKATLDRLNGRRGQQMLRAAYRATEPPSDQPPPTAPTEPTPVVQGAQVYDLAHWVARTRSALEPTFAAVTSLTADRFGQQLGEHETANSLAAVRTVLDDRLTRLAQTVSQTTFDQISAALHTGVTQHQTVQQMTAALEAVFDDAERNRAPMIARTESLGALNQAAQTYAQHAPDVIAGREWLSAHDSRVRPTHVEADGQVRSLTDPYLVGGVPMAFPHDPAAPPGEVINCRCTQAFLTPTEYARKTHPAAVAA